jgi:hypothetical protein
MARLTGAMLSGYFPESLFKFGAVGRNAGSRRLTAFATELIAECEGQPCASGIFDLIICLFNPGPLSHQMIGCSKFMGWLQRVRSRLAHLRLK